jgi:hypothetical protein
LDYWVNFLEQNLKVTLVILMKFLNPEPSSIFNSRRRFYPCWTPSLKKHCIQKCFTYFGLLFLLIKNIHPVHIPALTSLHDMAWLTGHATYRCGHKILYMILLWTLHVGVDEALLVKMLPLYAVPKYSVDYVLPILHRKPVWCQCCLC